MRNAGSASTLKAWQGEEGKGIEKMTNMIEQMRQETNEKLQGLKDGIEAVRVRERDRGGKLKGLKEVLGKVRDMWED